MHGGVRRGALGVMMLALAGCGARVALFEEKPDPPAPPVYPPPVYPPPIDDPPPPQPPQPKPPGCRSVAFDPANRAQHVVLSADRLVASVTTDSVNDSVRADLGLDRGTAYFEVTVTQTADETYNGIGIATDALPMELGLGYGDASSCGYERSGSMPCGGGAPPFDKLATYGAGSTVGVAVDLDAGHIWFSVDGQWQGGDPSTGAGGKSVTAGLTYYPVVNISQGDVYAANFGSAAFKHAVPKGFRAGWGSSCTWGANPIEANKCLSLVNGKLAMVDLTTGETVLGPTVGPEPQLSQVSSLGVLGDDVFFCEGSSLVRASLTLGTTTTIARSCDAATADASGLWVLSRAAGTLSLYPDLAAVLADKPSKVQGSSSLQSSRLGPSPSGLLGAWHSTNVIRRFEGDGTSSSVTLEGYDGWIFGVSAATGGRLVISSPIGLGGQAGLVAFDAATGQNLGVVAKAPEGGPFGFQGLHCGF